MDADFRFLYLESEFVCWKFEASKNCEIANEKSIIVIFIVHQRTGKSLFIIISIFYRCEKLDFTTAMEKFCSLLFQFSIARKT
jgi:hypothetical protein